MKSYCIVLLNLPVAGNHIVLSLPPDVAVIIQSVN